MVESRAHKVLEVSEHHGWPCHPINDHLTNNLSNCHCAMALDNVVCFLLRLYHW